jgi:hypothetical protein
MALRTLKVGVPLAMNFTRRIRHLLKYSVLQAWFVFNLGPNGRRPLMRNNLASIVVGTVAAFGCGTLHAKDVRFNRDVLPILADNCCACHDGLTCHGRTAIVRQATPSCAYYVEIIEANYVPANESL